MRALAVVVLLLLAIPASAEPPEERAAQDDQSGPPSAAAGNSGREHARQGEGPPANQAPAAPSPGPSSSAATPARPVQVSPEPARPTGHAPGPSPGGPEPTPTEPVAAVAPTAPGDAEPERRLPGVEDDASAAVAPAGVPAALAHDGALPPIPASKRAAAPVPRDATGHLFVERMAKGSFLRWSLPEGAVAVQVWREQDGTWAPVAQGTDGGQTVDAVTGLTQYRLTWTSTPIPAESFVAVGRSLEDVPVLRSTDPASGWLLGLLWGGVAVMTTMRVEPRQVGAKASGRELDLVALLGHLPGMDLPALQRLHRLGLRTVGQLRALDAEAIRFWAGVPADLVRQWQSTCELLQWNGLPEGAAERLALAGRRSLADLATARPAELMAKLREQTGVLGPGLPQESAELVEWVAEARLIMGLPEARAAPGRPGPA